MKTCLVPPGKHCELEQKKDEEDVFTCGEAEIRRIHKIPNGSSSRVEFSQDWLKALDE